MQPPKILIVDDNNENLFTLQRILKKLDVEVIAAKNGNEALIAVLENRFALAILDVQMPDMDGYELAQIIRDQDETYYLPIIFLTAVFSDEIHISKGYQSGAIDFLTKPFNPEILLYKVKILLELSQQKNHLEWQREQLLKTNHLLRESRDRAERINQRMRESLQYAKRIQYSLLPNPDRFQTCFKDSFYIWQSREIVGGDFIFAEPIGSQMVLAVIDCTGHGVPGAFMTIVAIFGLRHIIIENGITDPGSILSRLNRYIKIKLGQTQMETLSDDGLDAAVSLIDRDAHRITFAGAGLPLLYIANGQINRIKGDNHSLGYKHADEQFQFTNHTFEITSNTSVFMYTDGFIDQLGENDQRRYGTQRLKSLLLKNETFPFTKQKENLLKAFNAHKGTNDQQDDITLLGFRVEG